MAIELPVNLTFLSVRRIFAAIISEMATYAIPVGAGMEWRASTQPSDTRWRINNGDVLNIAEYPTLYALWGYTYGNGYGDGLTFNMPDDRGVVKRGVNATATVTGTGSADSTNKSATWVAHGFNRTGAKVIFSSGALTGLTAGTTYYVIVLGPDTLAFATSHLNAILDSRISISGANSAVLALYEDPDAGTRNWSGKGGAFGGVIGSRQDDQFQGHYHDFGGSFNSADGAATPASFVQASSVTTAVRDLSAREYVNTPRTGVNGVPRYGNETRGSNIAVNWITKVR